MQYPGFYIRRWKNMHILVIYSYILLTSYVAVLLNCLYSTFLKFITRRVCVYETVTMAILAWSLPMIACLLDPSTVLNKHMPMDTSWIIVVHRCMDCKDCVFWVHILPIINGSYYPMGLFVSYECHSNSMNNRCIVKHILAQLTWCTFILEHVMCSYSDTWQCIVFYLSQWRVNSYELLCDTIFWTNLHLTKEYTACTLRWLSVDVNVSNSYCTTIHSYI